MAARWANKAVLSSATLWQTGVPSSTMEACSSGLTPALSSPFLTSIAPSFDSMNWVMKDFSSRVSGSMIWYSSSMPMVREGGVIMAGSLTSTSQTLRVAATRRVSRAG